MSGNAQITDDQQSEIAGIFVKRHREILRGMPLEVAQGYIEKPDTFIEAVRRCGIIPSITPVSAIDFSLWLSKWEKFYKRIFGRKYDFSGIPIPQAEDIFAWLICMPGDVSAEDFLSAGKNPPVFWKWTNKPLDSVLNLSFGRDGWTHPHIVRIKANAEADEDLKNISAIKVVEMSINTAGLKERLAIGRFLYWDKGLILDQKTVTYCTGSRYSDGDVPHVYFDPLTGRVLVGSWDPSFADDFMRSRQAVSQ